LPTCIPAGAVALENRFQGALNAKNNCHRFISINGGYLLRSSFFNEGANAAVDWS
jgi:hypothetical protein